MKSLGKISAQAPYETSLGKMSLYKISRFVRACAVEMLMDMSQEPNFMQKFTGEVPDANTGARGTRFVRACAVEMHMDVSQEPFGAEIDKENAESPGNHFE